MQYDHVSDLFTCFAETFAAIRKDLSRRTPGPGSRKKGLIYAGWRSRAKLLVALLLALATLKAADWKPVEGQLLTRWAKEVSAETPWPEYPRPQLRRDRWVNLNGLWQYSVTERSALEAGDSQGEILVPFAIESALSGVKKPVSPDQFLWYKRSFDVPGDWNGQRVMLNFGAVDWEAVVFVNGIHVGEHRGGYTPFSFDITDALRRQGSQELAVRVWDPTNQGTQARGKQVLEPEGIWYTAVTGIWQTVWIEPVSAISIRRLRAVPDIDNQRFTLHTVLSGAANGVRMRVTVQDGETRVATAEGPAGEPLSVSIPSPRLWSPDSPHLYDLTVALVGGETDDLVQSYIGMRKISMQPDDRGDLRFFLNNKPLFHLGPLDQGWWPDGLYTAPTDEALRYDIEVTRELGFNAARKHVKVEPARWYYHCDRLGLMVWQDMPSAYLGGRGPNSLFVGPWDEEDAARDGVSAAQFEDELQELIDSLAHFPSIVMWVPFNEGWGQYDTARIAKWVKSYDSDRLVNAVSGWTDRAGAGDMYDTHMYPGPGMQLGGEGRAAILGEFGGLGWPVPDHLWWNKRNWGYRTYQSKEELASNYANVYHNLIGPWSRGVAAAIYTQTTDVEGEVNGLMTYDRALVKFDAATVGKIHGEFYGQPPKPSVVAPSAMTETQAWLYRFNQPAGNWNAPGADTGGWEKGMAPFRSSPDMTFPNGTSWPSGSIWIRRTFTVNERPENLWLEVLTNSAKGTIYLNGTKVADLPGGTRREYHHEDVSHALDALKVGENVLAVQAESDPSRRDRPRDLDVGLYALE